MSSWLGCSDHNSRDAIRLKSLLSATPSNDLAHSIGLLHRGQEPAVVILCSSVRKFFGLLLHIPPWRLTSRISFCPIAWTVRENNFSSILTFRTVKVSMIAVTFSTPSLTNKAVPNFECE